MDINSGIEFENVRLKLLWDLPKSDLFQIGVPEISETGNFARWKNLKLFGGRTFNLTVSFDKYENPNDKLEYVRLEDIVNEKEPWKTYEEFSILFFNLYGEPNEIVEFQGKPHKIWKFNYVEIILGIGERFIDYSVFVIKKRTILDT